MATTTVHTTSATSQCTPQLLSYRDLAHASYHESIHKRLKESMNIIDQAHALFKAVSDIYKSFCDQLLSICTTFSKTQITQEYSSDLMELWNFLLKFFSEEAQIHQESCDDMKSLICSPIEALTIHKKNQGDRLYDFRFSVEKMLSEQLEQTEQLHREYMDQYQLQREKYDPKLIPGLLNSHNSYVLQLVASNKMRDQYHSSALPAVLDELEDIQKGLIQTFNLCLCKYCGNSIKHYEKLMRFHDSMLSNIKTYSTSEHISSFVRQLNSNKSVAYWRRDVFLPPDGDCPEILARDDIIVDKLTEEILQQTKIGLVKEQSELQSFVSQNEDVIHTLKGLKQNGLSYTRSFEKLYELEEDICRKENEVRTAQIQLAGVSAQIEQMENRKFAGYSVKDEENTGVKKIWKKAVFSLKRDKGSKNSQSILKTMKRDSFRPGSSPIQNTITKDDSKVDPVYHLLRCAANKNQISNMLDELRDSNSSPTPKYNEATFPSPNGRLSLIQSAAINLATLSRRRFLMGQTKGKSCSVDETVVPSFVTQNYGGTNSTPNKDPGRRVSSYVVPQTDLEQHTPTPIRTSILHKSELPGQTEDRALTNNTNPTPSNHPRVSLAKTTNAKTISDIDFSSARLDIASTRSARRPSPQNLTPFSSVTSREKLSERMKSFSMDNPESGRCADSLSPCLISYDKKRMSNSYTNTTTYESTTYLPQSPRRRKVLYARKKSFSLDQEHQCSTRRVMFDEESLVKNKSSSQTAGGSMVRSASVEKKSAMYSGDQSANTSNKYVSGNSKSPDTLLKSKLHSSTHSRDETKRGWQGKSFSFDVPEVEIRPISDTRVNLSPYIPSQYSASYSVANFKTPTPSPKHDQKRLDRISESQEKSLSSESQEPGLIGDISGAVARTTAARGVLTRQKEYHDEDMGYDISMETPRGFSKKYRYCVQGNLHVVLFDFQARQKDELDLKAGWKVSAIDTSEKDWWKGKCNRRYGYFPSNYVQPIYEGEHVWRVVHEITVLETSDSKQKHVKLYKNQILVQAGSVEDDQVLIRTKSNSKFWCPIDCLARVFDSEI